MKTDTTDTRETNSGFHPRSPNDAPATRGMFAIILVLLVAGAVIAIMAYNRYNSDPKFPEPTEQSAPPLTP